MSYGILYVENEAIAGSMVKRMLEKRGHFVFHYDSAEACLDDLRDLDLRYDLAIVDRELGVRYSGDDLVIALKQKYSRRPILSISCYPEKAPDADSFLKKPFGIDDLVRKIGEIMTSK
ncbi:response regulator [Candidatus Woesearchaeota archaeon]|nr:response regulator [Candidatus Woesearchaeota archaeon]